MAESARSLPTGSSASIAALRRIVVVLIQWIYPVVEAAYSSTICSNDVRRWKKVHRWPQRLKYSTCKNCKMWTDTSGIIGVGYEGHDIDSFLQSLHPWKIDVLVDVRLNAISRKPGFSKKSLALALAGSDIRYEHFRGLGNPRDNRDGFAAPGTPAAETARERYRKLLAEDGPRTAIRNLAELAQSQHVALLCFEASEQCCHRRLVLDAVNEELSALARA
jgi:uncharacterized protein (DUF488 family)